MKAVLALLALPSALAIKCFSGPIEYDGQVSYMFVEPEADHKTCVTSTIDCGATANLNVCSEAERNAMLTKKFYSSSAQTCELAIEDLRSKQVSVTSYQCCTTEGCNQPVITDTTLQCNINNAGRTALGTPSAIILPNAPSDYKCYSFSVDCSDPTKAAFCEGGQTAKMTIAGVGPINCDDPEAQKVFPDMKCCTSHLCNGDYGNKFTIQTSEDGTTQKSDSFFVKMNAFLAATGLLVLAFI